MTRKRNRLNQVRLLLKSFLSLKLNVESEKFENDNRLLREKINTREQLNYELQNMQDEEVSLCFGFDHLLIFSRKFKPR